MILSISIAYIEANQQYREGGSSSKTGSGHAFSKGIARIFPNCMPPGAVDDLYSDVRCGLFHDGLTKRSVLISNEYPLAIDYQKSTIVINPLMFFDAVKQDFNDYIGDPQSRD